MSKQFAFLHLKMQIASLECGMWSGLAPNHDTNPSLRMQNMEWIAFSIGKMSILPWNAPQDQHEERERGGEKQGHEGNANSAKELTGHCSNFFSPG